MVTKELVKREELVRREDGDERVCVEGGVGVEG